MIKTYMAGRDDASLFGMLAGRAGSAGAGEADAVVAGILADVRARGDEAVLEYTRRFDGAELTPETMTASRREIAAAYEETDPGLLLIMKAARNNIERFHAMQKQNSWSMEDDDGTSMGQLIRPLDRVGMYVPAGSAPLPSTVLMDIVPAKIAGVGTIVMATPPGRDGRIDPAILAAADIAGADIIIKAGGAQAIAALAYGTATVPAVDKIVGPGNIYVNTAKRMIFGVCGIDMFAGPSEIAILADETADPAWLAADMLSQAEHDKLASAVLVTTSERIAEETARELDKQLAVLPRRETAEASLRDYGAIVLADGIEQAFEIINRIAPEHVELCVAGAESMIGMVRHAGAVFVGSGTPEPVGDYFAGPNHTLPTSGTARFFSPLGVYDFVKRVNYLSYSASSMERFGEGIAAFARAEGLEAHARAVDIRKSKKKKEE